MARILCIETSTEVCSVALTENGTTTELRENKTGLNHARLLTLFIDELLNSWHLGSSDLDALAVSRGPGSYTGLRIGVSVAKGFCYAAGKPLLAVCPLKAMANRVLGIVDLPGKEKGNWNPLFVPMIDARRMEAYLSVFDRNLNAVQEVSARIIDASFFDTFPEANALYLFGNGSEKFKNSLHDPRIHFISSVYTSAANMALPAYRQFVQNDVANLAYFEPFYLKDFIATVPRNKVIN